MPLPSRMGRRLLLATQSSAVVPDRWPWFPKSYSNSTEPSLLPSHHICRLILQPFDDASKRLCSMRHSRRWSSSSSGHNRIRAMSSVSEQTTSNPESNIAAPRDDEKDESSRRTIELKPNEPINLVASATKHWVDTIVVGQKLCPFVQPLKSSNTLRIVASTAQNVEQTIVDIYTEVELLLSYDDGAPSSTRSTTPTQAAVATPKGRQSFLTNKPTTKQAADYSDDDLDTIDDGESGTSDMDFSSDDDDHVVDDGTEGADGATINRNEYISLEDETDDSAVIMADHLTPESSQSATTGVVGHKARATVVAFDAPFVTDYLDFKSVWSEIMHQVVFQHNLQDDVDVWIFHPLAVHKAYNMSRVPVTAAVDYTLRSPYPVLVLLRTIDWRYFESIDSPYPPIEEMSESKNRPKFKGQGVKACRQRLENCHQHAEALLAASRNGEMKR